MADCGKYFCPRLLDYLVIAGCRYPNGNNQMSQTPELLRRYPLEDHKDFPLPNDVIFFCQPEGCISVGPKRMSLRETTSFVFTLTEKDSGLVRYGMCINFYRPFEKRAHSSEAWQKVDKSNIGSSHSVETLSSSECDRPRSPGRTRRKSRIRNNTLTSLCIVSHHPFFSTFRECLYILRRLIEACHDRSCVRRVGGSKATARDTVWGVLTGQTNDNISSLVMHEVREIETWILRLLSAPVPVPGKTRVEVHVLPKDLQPPLMFALPDNTRFSLVDFPLHLPLELLGVDTCLKALTAIMLEHKVILQSRDYNALSMSVMAFVSMLYPLEYMFPVIPLLPTCMASAEQLLLAPTPFLIGVPASFFGYKKDFPLPDDIWLVDLDGNKIIVPSAAESLPPLPEPEGTALKTHLKQALASMSMTPQPIKNLDALGQNPELWQRRDSLTSQTGFNPLIYGNDVDSVDVATRVAMVRFLNSPNTLGNFTEHTRTLRLYPRPVVAFQLYSFLKSRSEKTLFTAKLARTQAVEYLSEWSLCPTNLVYQRVQTAVYDPSLIGDKPKWYAQQLQPVEFHVYDNASSLGAAITSVTEEHSDDNPTDESGSDSDGAESTSSSYSSLSDFVSDLFNSDIRGETPSFAPEMQILAVDEAKVYSPPDKLHLPDVPSTNSDSALSLQEDSDMSSSASSSPSYSHEVDRQETVFRYDSGNMIDTSGVHSGSGTDSAVLARQGIPGAPGSPRSPNLARTASSQSPRTPPPRPHVPPKPSSPRMTPPITRKNLLPGPGPRHQSGSVSSGSSSSTRKPGRSSDGDKSSPSSIISTISNELTDMAHSATNTMSEIFGSNKAPAPPPQLKAAPVKPFTPLGNRKALVEKSGLVKHATNRKQKESPKPSPVDSKTNSNSGENQQFLKEVINSVLEGRGLSWMKVSKINKLMEDENYRNFVVSRLKWNLDKKVPEDATHLEDVCVSRAVLKGMLAILKAIIHGLGCTINNHGLGGMASAYVLFEIAHTHYWARDPAMGNKSDASLTPEMSLHGSQESLASTNRKLSDDVTTSKWWSGKRGSNPQPASPAPQPLTSATTIINSITTTTTTTTTNPVPASSVNPCAESFLSSPSTDGGSPVIVNGDEFENIEITSVSDNGGGIGSGRNDNVSRTDPHRHTQHQQLQHHQSSVVRDRNGNPQSSHPGGGTDMDWNRNLGKPTQQQGGHHRQQQAAQLGPGAPSCDIIVTDMEPDSRGHQAQGDMLRDMVKNKELIKASKQQLDRKFNSLDSEMSEASTLVSTSSEKEDVEKRRHRINHQSIRSTLSDSEMETNLPGGLQSHRSRSSSVWSNKSAYSSGYRYHDGRLIHTGTAGLTAESAQTRTYLFEGLLGKDRSRVWDHMQFWEDMFLDAVAQERDIIGMDQRPSEMMERYNSLGDLEKKRLEFDEDKLLAVMLYNQVAFMLMMRVSKNDIKKKIRRLLGKSHIGLTHSQDINNLLDDIGHLYGNDIDLKPMGSRQMQKQSFSVHWGGDNTGDMLFMEVCDDCLLLRKVTGAIHDRWWFEKLVNMTYCPKTKVLGLWRINQGKVQLNKFYTKKCRELYLSVKEAMEKAASRNSARMLGPELDGEFPVQDLKTKEGGLLQVCMEGIGLLLQNSKLFIELERIRKCFTQKDGIFVLEEFDPKTKQIIQHRFQSKMASEIVLMFHRNMSVRMAKAAEEGDS